MPFEHLRMGVEQFRRLGTKAIEVTGGGDPTLYPRINDYLDVLHDLGYSIGINTNAVDSDRIERWRYCDWVRVSLNTLDVHDSLDLDPILGAKSVSACYIWHKDSTLETFDKIANFCKDRQIVCRIAPDCIRPLEEIDSSVVFLRKLMEERHSYNPYLFLSDFNITTNRHNLDCRIHMIKPAFYTDGYVYPCPSVELAEENNSQMPHSFALCRYDEIQNFYTSGRALEAIERTCSYCKYEKQQVVLEEVLTPTEFNDFA